MIELPLDNRGAPGRDRDWVARSDCWAMREVVRMSCPVAPLNFQFGALIARFMVVNPAVQVHLESTNRRVDVIALRPLSPTAASRLQRREAFGSAPD